MEGGRDRGLLKATETKLLNGTNWTVVRGVSGPGGLLACGNSTIQEELSITTNTHTHTHTHTHTSSGAQTRPDPHTVSVHACS